MIRPRCPKFTQSQHDINCGQACSDESDWRIGVQPSVGLGGPCIVMIETHITGGFGDSWKRSWVKISSRQNDEVGTQLANVFSVAAGSWFSRSQWRK